MLEALTGSLRFIAGTCSGGPAGPFAGLAHELDDVQAVQEVGPATVDGQQVTEFTASLPVSKLLSPRQRRLPANRLPPTASIELELFIAPDGLPVRTTSLWSIQEESIAIQGDILALEVPVVVHAPPTRKTITQAQLRKLERCTERNGTLRCSSAQAIARASALCLSLAVWLAGQRGCHGNSGRLGCRACPTQSASAPDPATPDVTPAPVLYGVADGVATLTLNDPATRNSLSAELIGGLIAGLQRAREDDAVRCVVLASSHEKVFSSGANLGGFSATYHWCTSTSAPRGCSRCCG